MQPFPTIDHDRENRLLMLISDQLHEPYDIDENGKLIDLNTKIERRMKRWIQLILEDIQFRRRWWFLDNISQIITLTAGQDVVDIKGDISKIVRVYAPNKLTKVTLSSLQDWRMDTLSSNRPNAGPVKNYALEAGRRIHLQPAPNKDTNFAIYYSRPIAAPILPSGFDNIVLNGVIGRFGRHFDRDALTEDPVEFENRYERDLRAAANDSWDVERHKSYEDAIDACATVGSSNSASDSAIDLLTPVSIKGIGYAELETGDYPFEVA